MRERCAHANNGQQTLVVYNNNVVHQSAYELDDDTSLTPRPPWLAHCISAIGIIIIKNL